MVKLKNDIKFIFVHYIAQEYLQLAMAEDDTKKNTFNGGSSGLYEFTHKPFGL